MIEGKNPDFNKVSSEALKVRRLRGILDEVTIQSITSYISDIFEAAYNISNGRWSAIAWDCIDNRIIRVGKFEPISEIQEPLENYNKIVDSLELSKQGKANLKLLLLRDALFMFQMNISDSETFLTRKVAMRKETSYNSNMKLRRGSSRHNAPWLGEGNFR